MGGVDKKINQRSEIRRILQKGKVEVIRKNQNLPVKCRNAYFKIKSKAGRTFYNVVGEHLIKGVPPGPQLRKMVRRPISFLTTPYPSTSHLLVVEKSEGSQESMRSLALKVWGLNFTASTRSLRETLIKNGREKRDVNFN